MLFFIADPHFGHQNIIRYCQRPFADAAEMDRCLTANWNARVGADDDIYILGDFSLKHAPEALDYYRALNGRKHLIVGNHDLYLKENRKVFERELCEICDYKELHAESGHTYILMHYPLLFWNSLFTLASQRPDVLHSHEDLGWSIRQLQIYKHVKAKMEEMPQFKDHPVLTYLQGMFALRPMAIKPQLQLAAQYFGRAVIWGSVGAAAWSFADLNPLVGAKVLSDPQQLPQAELKGGDQKTGGDGTITVQAVQ